LLFLKSRNSLSPEKTNMGATTSKADEEFLASHKGVTTGPRTVYAPDPVTLVGPSNAAVAQQPLEPKGCNAASMYQYQKQLEAWNACQFCGRYGYASVQTPEGFVCDTTRPVPGAFNACASVAPSHNPCNNFEQSPNFQNTWQQLDEHSWGSSVYDPKYGRYILWGTWDEKNGRPYFADQAPYLRAGINAPCQ
jgi:hypothetical protein